MKFSDILGLAVFLPFTSATPIRQVCEDDCTCFTGPVSLGFDTQEECIAYAKANDYPEWLGKRQINIPAGCDGNYDLCLTFISPANQTSVPIKYGLNAPLGLFIDGTSKVEVSPVYDLTQCSFAGKDYECLDPLNQPPQCPDTVSKRLAVQLAGEGPNLYNIGPPQLVEAINCPKSSS